MSVIPYLSEITPVLNNPFNNIETGTENYSKYQSDMKMRDDVRWCIYYAILFYVSRHNQSKASLASSIP